MATTQLSALTKKPYYGLDYGAIVKAKAASLPAAYAATEDAEYNQDVLKNANAGVAIQQEALNVDKQEKENQLKYYNDMTALSAEEAAAAKSNAATSNALGVAGLGVGAYGAYNNSLLADKIAALTGAEASPGIVSKGLTSIKTGLTGVKEALGLNSSPVLAEAATPLGETALMSNPSTPALIDAASAAAPEAGSLAASTATNAGMAGTAATGTYVGEGAAYGTNALVGAGAESGAASSALGLGAESGAAYGAAASTPGISGTAATGTYVGEGAAYGANAAGVGIGTIASYAVPAVIAAHYGMPVLGNILSKVTPGEEGSSNVFQQGAREVGNNWDRPIEGVSELLGINVSEAPKIVQVLANPGSFIADFLGFGGGGGCIIVTACTDRNSPEVNVTRQYRDMFLTPGQLRGYYWLAEKLVPRMQKSDSLCKYMKKHLVDHLIRYGEYKLDLTEKKPSIMDRVTSNIFLAVIKTIGFAIPKYVRINGEVY